MKYELEISPAYDKRDPDPAKNCGTHGVDFKWLLRGRLGVVQFLVYTNWLLPHVREEFESSNQFNSFFNKPLPADIGYHSKVPLYDGHKPTGSSSIDFNDIEEVVTDPDLPPVKLPKLKSTGTYSPCCYLDGEPCFYDGSSLNAERIFDILVAEGQPGLYRELKEFYERSLGEEIAFWKYLYVFHSSEGWFYLYRHVSGFWEKSRYFESPEKALKHKVLTVFKVLLKRSINFVLNIVEWFKTRRQNKEIDDVLNNILSSHKKR